MSKIRQRAETYESGDQTLIGVRPDLEQTSEHRGTGQGANGTDQEGGTL